LAIQASSENPRAQSGGGVKRATRRSVGAGRNKVLRGGGWNNNWNNVRAANRNNNNPTNRNNNIGFRCVSVAPGEFLKGLVRLIHGCGASAEREKVQVCSRLGFLQSVSRLNRR